MGATHKGCKEEKAVRMQMWFWGRMFLDAKHQDVQRQQGTPSVQCRMLCFFAHIHIDGFESTATF